jgi:hypothetical protein
LTLTGDFLHCLQAPSTDGAGTCITNLVTEFFSKIIIHIVDSLREKGSFEIFLRLIGDILEFFENVNLR